MRISNKTRFILDVIAGDVVLNNRKRAEIEAMLEQKGYDKLSNQKKTKEDEDETSDSNKGYEYLLSMPLSSLTLEKVEALKKQQEQCQEEVDALNSTSEAQLWRSDLEEFLEVYAEYEREEACRDIMLKKQQEKARRAEIKGKKAKKKGKGKKKANAWSDSEESGMRIQNDAWHLT